MLFAGPVPGASPLRPSSFDAVLFQCSRCEFTGVRYFDVEHHACTTEACKGARVVFERRRVTHEALGDGAGGGGVR